MVPIPFLGGTENDFDKWKGFRYFVLFFRYTWNNVVVFWGSLFNFKMEVDEEGWGAVLFSLPV